MFAILSNIEMDQRLHKKYNECDKGNYNKDDFHFTIYNPENIIPGDIMPPYDMSVIVKYKIRVACNHAKRFGDVGAFNRVSFIIIPIRVLQAEVDVVCIIGNLGIREVSHCAVMR